MPWRIARCHIVTKYSYVMKVGLTMGSNMTAELFSPTLCIYTSFAKPSVRELIQQVIFKYVGATYS